MRKQAIINLSDYYYGKNQKKLKNFTLILIFFPVLLTTFISILKFTGMISILVKAFTSNFSIRLLFDNYLEWNLTFNIILIAIHIIKTFSFMIYSVGIYGIVKYRLPLSYKLVKDICTNRWISTFIISFVIGLISWFVSKIPIIGGAFELTFTYFILHSTIIYMEFSDTLGVLDSIIGSLKFSLSNLLSLLLLDIYYLFTPTLIGLSIIIGAQILGTLTSFYLITMFGVLIGSIGICRKIPKAFLAKVIFYLVNPAK